MVQRIEVSEVSDFSSVIIAGFFKGGGGEFVWLKGSTDGVNGYEKRNVCISLKFRFPLLCLSPFWPFWNRTGWLVSFREIPCLDPV